MHALGRWRSTVPALAAANLEAEAPRPRLIDTAALLAVYLIWGSTYYALRVGLKGFPPFVMAGARFLLAGALLYGFLRLRGAPRVSGKEWRASSLIGFLLLGVGNGAVSWSEQWVSSGLAALVVATMPLWTALMARALGQRTSGREWVGLLVGFFGVALLSLGGELRAHGLAALVLSIAPLSWALGSVLSRRVPLPAGAMATATEMLTGGAMMLLFGLVRGERMERLPPTRPVIAFTYLVVFGSLVAFSAYNHLLRHVRPAVAVSYAYVNPLIAMLLGVGLGGESIARSTWLAAAVIVAGVAILTIGRGADHDENRHRSDPRR
jgi:drug/metabolite transporter (DMT)-like permease